MLPHHAIAIVGTGFSGLGMAIRLRQAGFGDLVLLERDQEVGGVWRDNRYPGAACDVQSHLYSLSFARNPRWSRTYAPQEEIWAYLKDTASRFGLRERCRFGHNLEEASWDSAARRWRLRTSGGDLTARVLITATGALSDPSIPALPGLERFAGKVMHSARWDPGYPLEGKRVAVVGTGASSVQFIPSLQPRVAALHVFQRTPPWILPRGDRPVPGWLRELLIHAPALQSVLRAAIHSGRELMVPGFLHPWLLRQAQRLALRHLERTVPDPVLRAKLTPDYLLGCKRVLLSDDYLQSLMEPNVEVIASALVRVGEHEVWAADGTRREVDTILFGTGFQVTELPIARQVRGRGGQTLEEAWAGSAKAYLGTTVAGFPNLFILQGPNTGLGHSSVLEMIEGQIEHTLRAVRYLEECGVAAIEPTAEAQQAFVEEVDRRMKGTVWMQGGCVSWYLDRTGRNSTMWPGTIRSFRRRVEAFDPTAYQRLTWGGER